MHFMCHETNKLLSSDFGGFSHHWMTGLDNINYGMWTKIVHSGLVAPSQVVAVDIEFKLRQNGYGKRIYYFIR